MPMLATFSPRDPNRAFRFSALKFNHLFDLSIYLIYQSILHDTIGGRTKKSLSGENEHKFAGKAETNEEKKNNTTK